MFGKRASTPRKRGKSKSEWGGSSSLVQPPASTEARFHGHVIDAKEKFEIVLACGALRSGVGAIIPAVDNG